MYFEVKLHDFKTQTDLKWRTKFPKIQYGSTHHEILSEMGCEILSQLCKKHTGLLVNFFPVFFFVSKYNIYYTIIAHWDNY